MLFYYICFFHAEFNFEEFSTVRSRGLVPRMTHFPPNPIFWTSHLSPTFPFIQKLKRKKKSSKKRLLDCHGLSCTISDQKLEQKPCTLINNRLDICSYNSIRTGRHRIYSWKSHRFPLWKELNQKRQKLTQNLAATANSTMHESQALPLYAKQKIC